MHKNALQGCVYQKNILPLQRIFVSPVLVVHRISHLLLILSVCIQKETANRPTSAAAR